MPGFDFVYFDLDDTLLDHQHAEGMALADVVASFPALGDLDVSVVRETYHRINSALWKAYGAGEIDREFLRHQRFARLLTSLKISGVDPLVVGDAYMEYYGRHWKPVDGSIEVLQSVAKVLPVGIITNGFAEVQRRKLERFPEIADSVDAIVISEEVGHMKPQPELFAAARRAAQCDGALLYVGDSYQSDVVGALASGWSVAWYCRGDATNGAGADLGGARRRLDALLSTTTQKGLSATVFSDFAELGAFVFEDTTDDASRSAG